MQFHIDKSKYFVHERLGITPQRSQELKNLLKVSIEESSTELGIDVCTCLSIYASKLGTWEEAYNEFSYGQYLLVLASAEITMAGKLTKVIDILAENDSPPPIVTPELRDVWTKQLLELKKLRADVVAMIKDRTMGGNGAVPFLDGISTDIEVLERRIKRATT